MLEYATLKEADLLMRRAKEEERFAARQAQRQKMIDEGVRQLADLNASTNNRLEAQAIEVANKAAEARHAPTTSPDPDPSPSPEPLTTLSPDH